MQKELGPNSDLNLLFEENKKIFSLRNYDKALSGFTSLVDQNPQNAEYIAWLARTYSAKGDDLKSLELANKALKTDYKQPLAYFVRGMAHVGQKNQQQALFDFDTSISLDPGFSRVYTWRADILFDQKKYKEAVDDYSKCLELEPEGKSILRSRALGYFNIGNIEEGIVDMARYYEYQPKNFEPGNDPLGLIPTTNKHFAEKMLPQITNSGEHFIESWIGAFIWGRSTDTKIFDGFSTKYEYGTKGVGYLCLTDKNIYIISFGTLSQKIYSQNGFVKFLAGTLSQSQDYTEIEKADKIITLKHSLITGSKITIDKNSKEEELEILSSESNCSISANDLKNILTGINMGAKGRLTEIWKPIPEMETAKSQKDVLALIEKLSELNKKGALSNEEFENKKKELLSRL